MKSLQKKQVELPGEFLKQSSGQFLEKTEKMCKESLEEIFGIIYIFFYEIPRETSVRASSINLKFLENSLADF